MGAVSTVTLILSPGTGLKVILKTDVPLCMEKAISDPSYDS